MCRPPAPRMLFGIWFVPRYGRYADVPRDRSPAFTARSSRRVLPFRGFPQPRGAGVHRCGGVGPRGPGPGGPVQSPWGQQRARRWPRGPWRAGAAVPAALPPTVPHSPFQPAGTPGPSVSPSRHHLCVRAWEREAAGLSLDGSEPRPRASAWRSRPRAPRERTSVGAVAGEEVLASAGGRCPLPAGWRRECPCFACSDGASQAVPGRQAGAGRAPRGRAPPALGEALRRGGPRVRAPEGHSSAASRHALLASASDSAAP